ncbi:Glycerophosphodiester phosphodiesterase gde1 [Auxenochlorella protothecoides]|uniref:glycerophosphodiester phosphodiesterase n=1 Tax=Auxenochlorella protothecoides TaxID=3075 RepID=A0A087SFA1_AUXPR|nr:Glycerophosphodiester phosphodiesterase gde1 [Auxenochlorella protothecoides]KFM24405.1 Glycerophosphodiester phosphodiesterase gde1 [Auxenochlorella protothecoides]
MLLAPALVAAPTSLLNPLRRSGKPGTGFGRLLDYRSNVVALGGHRGLGANYWDSAASPTKPSALRFPVRENTIPSFLKSVAAGASFIEFDVQVTGDGVPVIWHDNYVITGTPEAPINRLIADLTYAEFCALVPTSADLPLQKAGQERLPSLAELFAAMPPHVAFDIEVKVAVPSHRAHTPSREVDRLLGPILAGLAHRRPDDAVMFLSGGGAYRHADPRRTSFAAAVAWAAAAELAGVIFHAGRLRAEPGAVRAALDAGLQVMTYGLDNVDAEYVQEQYRAGVHGVIVDDVSRQDNICVSNAFVCTAATSDPILRRLEDDFAYFSGMGQGSNVTLGSSDSADSAATHDCEARFLNNFLHLANRAHFRVLNVGELEAAFADDFLFTLPVTVNYDAMDPGLLSRYWESRPEAAAASRLPEPLSDRAIILHRGVDMVTVEDQFIQQKIDCLISFYILQPLWTALISVARVFGADKELQEKAPPGLGDSPYVQPDASDTGKQSSSGSESPVKSSEDLAESSQRAGPRHNWMLDRQTFRTWVKPREQALVFPNGKAVLKQLFKPIALQEVCLRDIILLYRPAMAKDGEEPKDVPLWKRGGQVEGMDREMLKQTMVLKRFRSVPLADLEMMLPDKTVYIPPNQYVSVGITVISGLVALLTTFLQSESMGVIFSGNLLKALGGILLSRAGQVAMQLQAEKASMMYEKTLAAQQAVLSGLTDEVTRQRVRELFVAYCVLEQAKKALATEDLATAYAEYLSKTFDANVEMDGEHTLRTLRTWGLVKQATDGAWLAIPAERAEEALGRVWNDLYTYKPVGLEEGSAW